MNHSVTANFADTSVNMLPAAERDNMVNNQRVEKRMKLVALDREYWPRGGYGHWCPGCKCGHEIDTEQRNYSGAIWQFNGDLERPTFTPSVHLQVNPRGHEHYQPDIATTVCHYFITDGQIQFLGDCTHELVGKTVDLPPIPSGTYSSSVWKATRGSR